MSAPTAPPATTAEPGQLTKDTYRGRIHPDWCPGCGDFSVLAALQTALFELELQPNQACVISGIGCSSNLPGYINTYGMHTLHGRALAVATGVRLGNHELKVICTGGDGDGFGIGGNHFVHTMRRNVDLTYIVMDNQIYGLTTGQCSPTSVKGMKTKSTPHGSVENPINPIPMAIVGGATYVARGFSGKQKHLVELLKGAILHKGFSLVDVFSPCVTYNKDNTYQWFNPRGYLKRGTRSTAKIHGCLVLLAFQPVIRMPLVVSDQRDTDASGQLAVKKVVGKPPEVGPPEPRFDGMKSSWIGRRERDEMP